MSVLFADLVGFTAASESADPEDVRARLVPYHQMLRARVEGFGGTVEKFVGDAVMAVFGAPVAHEDDPERAVRSGLAILEGIGQLNAEAGLGLAVRVGVNTGEVVVALGARPEAGEGFVTGDVVNTAARIQTAAPIGAVAVSRATYEATSRVFAFERMDPVTVKGKAEPLVLWRAGAPRARLGADVTRANDTPLVGRELDLLQLRAAFDRTVRDASVQLVTVSGEPGVGKTRLVAELRGYVAGLPDLVTWRVGRCLPYGDGITFWALGEIVKAHAGILDSDDAQTATAKLDAVLPRGEDRAWLRARLLPLLGITGGGSGAAAQEESFTAWRRFLESFTSTGPAVLVVEDIHWADEALLAFLEHLTGWAHGVPLLVVCTARPELLDTHPSWGAGLRNIIHLNLAGLSAPDTAALVSRLLGLTVLPAETQQLILDRAEGNPLWAEECVRVLRDRDLIDAQGRLRDQNVPLPQGIQALIAARLDTLTPDRKTLLADAAVIGRVFWAGALAAMADRDPTRVTRALHELTGKELVRPHRESSLAGQPEYAFWHALVRDVAYGTLPRPARARKHLAAAGWLENQAADRAADVAEILAEHTGHALDLATAAGDHALVDEVTPAARRHALLAGEKLLGLDAARAMTLLERALALTPPDHPDHADVLITWARARSQAGHAREACDALQKAAALHLAAGHPVPAGGALAEAAGTLLNLGDPTARAVLDRAITLLQTEPAGPELVLALTTLGFEQFTSGRPTQALATLQRAESLADRNDDRLLTLIARRRGEAKVQLGEPDALTYCERCVQRAVDLGEGQSAAIGYGNLANSAAGFEGPEAALNRAQQAERFALDRGLRSAANFARLLRPGLLFELGRLDEAATQADAELLIAQEQQSKFAFVYSGAVKVLCGLELGRPAPHLAEAVLTAARDTGTPEVLVGAAPAAASSRSAGGDRAGAVAVLQEVLATHQPPEPALYSPDVHKFVRGAVAAGDSTLARRLIKSVQTTSTALPATQHGLVTARALVAQDNDDHATAADLFADAAQRWASFGSRLEQAHALLGLGRSLTALGRTADKPLSEARNLFQSMGALPRVRQCDQLLDPTAQVIPPVSDAG